MEQETPAALLGRFEAHVEGIGAVRFEHTQRADVLWDCERMIARLRAGVPFHGGDKVLSTSLLAWLLADERFAATVRGGRIHIESVAFEQALDLAGLDRRWSLTLRACRFARGLDLAGARLRDIDLSSSEASWIHAPRLDLAGDLIAHRLRGGPLVIEDAHVHGSVRLAGARLTASPESIAAIHRRIGSSIYPESAALAADRLRVDGKVELRAVRDSTARCTFEARGTTYLRSAKIGGILDLQGARLIAEASHGAAEALLADSIQVEGPVYLTSWEERGAPNDSPMPFEAVGEIDLSESEIDGSVWLGWFTQLSAAKIAQRSRVASEEGVRAADAILRAASSKDRIALPSRGALILSGSKITGAVSVIAAEIEGAILLPNTNIVGNVEIIATAIRQTDGQTGERVALNCDGTQIGDTLFILRSRLSGMVCAIEARVTCEIMIEGAVLAAEAGTRGAGVALTLRGVRAGYVHVAECEIQGLVNLAQGRIDSNLLIEKTTHRWSEHGVEEGHALLNLDTAHIGGELSLALLATEAPPMIADDGARHFPAVNGRGLHVGRDVKIGAAPDQACATVNGAVALTNAQLGGDVLIRRLRIEARGSEPLNLSGSSVAGNLEIESCDLTRVCGQPRKDDNGTEFYIGDEVRALTMRDGDIHGSVRFHASCRVCGGIDFGGTRIAADLVIEEMPIDLPKPVNDLDQTAHLGALDEGEYHTINLSRATIGGDWRWGPLPKGNAASARAPRGIVNLGNATIGRLCPSPTWQPQWVKSGEVPSYLRLSGCTFVQIGEESLHDVDWLRWAALQDPSRFAIQPYEQLGRVLRQMGNHHDADLIARQKLRETRRQRRSGSADYAIERAHRIREELRLPSDRVRKKHCKLGDPFAVDPLLPLMLLGGLGVVWLIALLSFDKQTVGWFGLLAPARRGMKWLADNVVDHVWRDGTLAILLILLAMVFLLILARLSTSAHERTRRRIFDVWGRILDYGLGYGYLPGRAVFLSAMVVISGGFIYKHAASEGHFRPVDARRFDPNWAVPEPPMAGQPPKPREMRPPPPDTYPALNPLLYSFEQFVPFIALKHVQYWELDGASPPWLHAYKTLHILLGYILVTAVALSPVAIFRKD